MNFPTIESDFLFALVGSTLFWSTLAGISIRTMRVDFQALETHLKNFYRKADQLSFPVFELSTFFADRTFGALYGRGPVRMFMATLLACTVSCLYIFASFVGDSHRNKERAEKIVLDAIEHVDADYWRLVRSDQDRQLLAFAHAQDGGNGFVYFIHNDDKSVALRAAHDRFWPKYKSYIATNHLTRFDALDRYFGKAYSNPYWQGVQTFQLFCGILLTVAGSAIVDFLAVAATYLFYEGAKARKKPSIAYLLVIPACFVLSEVGYLTFFEGAEGTIVFVVFSLFLVLLYPLVICLLIAGVVSLQRVENRVVASFGILALVLFTAIRWPSTVFGPLTFVSEEYERIGAILSYGISREAILMGMMSVYPLILLVAIFAATGICKILFVCTKTVLLGQVYGASVLSGSTFFFGFLTTIISSTSVAYTLIRALLGAATR